jgi:hypothetical protein
VFHLGRLLPYLQTLHYTGMVCKGRTPLDYYEKFLTYVRKSFKLLALGKSLAYFITGLVKKKKFITLTSGPNVTKHFLFVIYEFQHEARVFVPGEL